MSSGRVAEARSDVVNQPTETIIGIDTGGTFVDVVVRESDAISAVKVPSDPANLAGSVLDGLEQAAAVLDVSLGDLLAKTRRIVHGSTVATNALLTGNTAYAALLTTKGFRDIVNMRRGVRERGLDSHQAPPRPLVPRRLIRTIDERLDCEGRELRPVDLDELAPIVERLRGDAVEAVAICFLFSFLDPAHERQVAAYLREHLPGVHLSLSSDVLPQVRLYERESTTVVNAAVSPVLDAYLESLESRLRGAGFNGRLHVMQSNGGICSPDIARRQGVGSVLSGPASAPVAATRIASGYDLSNAICVDMGGTSFDVCLITDGSPRITSLGGIAGYRIAIPMVDIHTVGAGGGSIVEVDSRGVLRAGPASAGAYPGPACYGRGGTKATVTDANLLLGYVHPMRFWGGRLGLDVAAAERAMSAAGDELGLTAVETAWAAYRVVNEAMVDAIREVSVRQGFDPRRFALIAAGGAAPLHVASLAAELGFPVVVIPRLASVLCALGGVLSDAKYEFVTTLIAVLADADLGVIDAAIARLTTEARATLDREDIAPDGARFEIHAGLRYVGQFQEVEVDVPRPTLDRELVAEIVEAFHERHEVLNGYQARQHAVELVNLRVVAVAPMGDPRLPPPRAAAEGAGPIERRPIYWDGTELSVDVFDGEAGLGGDASILGPALVEYPTTTIVVPPDFQLSQDSLGNAFLHRADLTLRKAMAAVGGKA
jgi:N-methylhydantoinase A